MNSKVIPRANPTLHLSYQSTNKTTTATTISRISFNPHLTKSRISTTNPIGQRGTRSTTRIHSSLSSAPTEEATETLYEVLGIAESCSGLSGSDIKKAYKQMARKYHPDVSSPDQVDEHTKRFIMVQQAYKTLSDPQIRSLYDRDLARGLRSAFSSERYHQHNNQRMEETGGWRTQLDELKERRVKGNMSWGARIRSNKCK